MSLPESSSQPDYDSVMAGTQLHTGKAFEIPDQSRKIINERINKLKESTQKSGEGLSPLWWLIWPEIPLIVGSLGTIFFLILSGMNSQLVLPILQTATPVLMFLALVLLHVETHGTLYALGRLKIWLGIMLIWWQILCYLGMLTLLNMVPEKYDSWARYFDSGPFVDSASQMASLDMALAAILEFIIFERAPKHINGQITLDSFLDMCHRALMGLTPTTYATYGSNKTQPWTAIAFISLIGLVLLKIWGAYCKELNPWSLFPGMSPEQMIKSPSAIFVCGMMILTALLGFMTTYQLIHLHCKLYIDQVPIFNRGPTIRLGKSNEFKITLGNKGVPPLFLPCLFIYFLFFRCHSAYPCDAYCWSHVVSSLDCIYW